MSDIINIKEYFKKYSNLYHFEEGNPEYLICEEDFRSAIKEIVEAVIDKCKKEATIDADEGGFTEFVDKQSIDNVKTMIKYE